MAVLIDTSFFIAYINNRDKNHEGSRKLAAEIFSGKYGQFIITDHIFDETITTCLHRLKNKSKIEQLGYHILNSEIKLLQINEELFMESWDMFKKYHYSFTDCTSAALSKKLKINHIAAYDHHFDAFPWLNRIS
jgi:predicted nucleic acid-binding protein